MEGHPWSERLDLGHDPMDHDHHLQLRLLGAVVSALEEGRPAMARRLAEELAAASELHFAGEEQLMRASGFRDLAVHGGEHEALLARMRELAAADAGEDASLALTLALELQDRLSAHVAGSDRAVAEHLVRQ